GAWQARNIIKVVGSGGNGAGGVRRVAWLGGRGSSFEPDLNFVAIRIGDVSVREAGSELATTEQPPSGAFHLGDGTVDVVGIDEPKAEMRDAPPETGRGGVLGEGEDVVPTRRLRVDEPVS